MAVTSSSEVLIRQRLRALGRTLPAAQQGDAQAIHQARVATRRLREALPLVVDGAAGRRLARRARALTRALGPVRELDVVLQTLDAIDAAGDVPRPAIACLRTVVGDELRRLRAEMARRVASVDLSALRTKAIAGARAHDHALARAVARGRKSGARRRQAGSPAGVATADRRSARRGGRLRAAIENAAGIYLPDRLHDVRIAVKKLRYAMEVARDVRGSKAVVRIRTLKRAQDLLGRIHDLEVVIARARAVQGSPGALDLQLSAALDALVRRLETECRRLHGHYIAARAALVAVCDHVEALPRRRHEPAA